jgi:hypothetical protein
VRVRVRACVCVCVCARTVYVIPIIQSFYTSEHDVHDGEGCRGALVGGASVHEDLGVGLYEPGPSVSGVGGPLTTLVRR